MVVTFMGAKVIFENGVSSSWGKIMMDGVGRKWE